MVFTDASPVAGIQDSGLSFGAAAGDANGDGWVDLFTGGHYTSHPHLWINQRNGTFADATFTMVPYPTGDLHGAQWADLDNDGAAELILMRGANYGMTPTPKYVYKRFGTQLVDIATFIGLDVPLMRARTPLAVDLDGNGLLDLFLTAALRSDGIAPPGPYLRRPWPGFASNWPTPPLVLGSDCLFGTLGDLDGDQRLDLLLHAFPLRAFAFNAAGFTPLTGLGLPTTTSMYDAVIADLTGDGRNEVYIARAATITSFERVGTSRLVFHPIAVGQEHGVRFSIPTAHTLYLDWGPTPSWPVASVFLGGNGHHPANNGVALDPNDPANAGIQVHTPGQSNGIYVGWDPIAREWSISLCTPVWNEALLRMTATAPMGTPTAFGSNASPAPLTDLLLERVNGTYTNRAAVNGIPGTLSGRSVVAADFDNDMDLDLYVVTATTCANTPNVLLENDGTGHFTPVLAGDAGGSSAGIGDSVITLDHDHDGDVDLFVVNGDCSAFRQTGGTNAFGDDGPAQLLRNDTQNGNRWLDLQLRGTVANREGIGARIEVTAGGIVQVREHGGGMHRYSQNSGIHFGLGQNAMATRVEVLWPSGSRMVLTNVQANQRLTIRQ